LDRVASAWLIRRFVDTEADFQFVSWNDREIGGLGEFAFGLPGIDLGAHDADGSCFRKILSRYELDDPALELVERIVAAGVAHALHTEPPSDTTEEEQLLGAGLDLLGHGLGLAFDDDRHLEVGLAIYDGVYILCRLRTLPEDVRANAPRLLPDRIPYLRRAIDQSAYGSPPATTDGPNQAGG
jgi:hypothetical protein